MRYSDAFGLTMLRLYSGLFGLWVGVVFILLCTRMLVPALGRRWVAAAGGLGLTLLFALNVVNPEAIVVRWDIGHTDPVDAHYLSHGLSTDAIPTLVDSLDQLDARSAEEITGALCLRHRSDADGVLSWNRSRAKARAALEALCD